MLLVDPVAVQAVSQLSIVKQLAVARVTILLLSVHVAFPILTGSGVFDIII